MTTAMKPSQAMRSGPLTTENYVWLTTLVVLVTIVVIYGQVKSNRIETLATKAEIARREAEQDVSRLNAMIKSLNNVASTYYIVQSGGVCEFITDGMCELLGRERSECIGHNMHHLIHHHKSNGDIYRIEDCLMFQAMTTNTPTVSEDDVIWTAKNEPIPCRWCSSPFTDAGKNYTRITIIPTGEQQRQTQRVSGR